MPVAEGIRSEKPSVSPGSASSVGAGIDKGKGKGLATPRCHMTHIRRIARWRHVHPCCPGTPPHDYHDII